MSVLVSSSTRRVSVSVTRWSFDSLATSFLTSGGLRLEFPGVNHKRVYRLYSAANLTVRKRKKVRRPPADRTSLNIATKVNEVWSMDFVSDSLANGSKQPIRSPWLSCWPPARVRCWHGQASMPGKKPPICRADADAASRPRCRSGRWAFRHDVGAALFPLNKSANSFSFSRSSAASSSFPKARSMA